MASVLLDSVPLQPKTAYSDAISPTIIVTSESPGNDPAAPPLTHSVQPPDLWQCPVFVQDKSGHTVRASCNLEAADVPATVHICRQPGDVTHLSTDGS